ncbi:MAG: tripartite tricarboxylate transporter TctB family protein [Hyphomicrobiales bacterium]|nr:tripartite tricarboxylate transporter TctB family protein [Hyphomicrobiales bacterium]
MRAIEITVTALLLGVVTVFGLQLGNIGAGPQANQFTSPHTIPTIFLIASGVFFGAVLVQCLLRRDGQDIASPLRDMLKRRRMVMMAAACAYVLVMDVLGFVAATLIFIPATICLIGVDVRREWWAAALVTVVTVGGVYVIVIYGLESYLPEFEGFGRAGGQ